MENLCSKIEERIRPLASEMKLSIYDILYIKEGGYNYLQIFIESNSIDVSLDTCVEFSNKIDPIIDEYIDDKFFLEVSTPGLEKKLRKVKHYKDVIYKCISVRTKSNIENSRKFEGILKEVYDEYILLNDEKLSKDIKIEFGKIKDAKLIYNISEEYLKRLEEE